MKAKFFKEIIVKDPDTNADVSLSIFKHDNGGILAIDSSYIEQTFDDGEEVIINDCLNDEGKIELANI